MPLETLNQIMFSVLRMSPMQHLRKSYKVFENSSFYKFWGFQKIQTNKNDHAYTVVAVP